jgi:hypothetical protein
MRGISAAAVLVVCALRATGVAQVHQPDFSGRWRLVPPTAAERARETLAIDAPDELLITQTPLAITIEHPSKRGSHPEAGVFKYGVGGTVSGLPGSPSHETRWGVSHIETDLVITRSATDPNARGVRTTVERESVWRLSHSDRLVIEFSESRTGAKPRTAARVYVRLND